MHIMSTSKTIHVFLSHNSVDKPQIEQMAHRLKGAGFKVWLDKWNLIPGDPWQEGIEDALGECDCCLVFVGKEGIGPWQNAEMRAAIDDQVSHRRMRVIPVLLPNAERGDPSQLPTFLRRNTWVEFRHSLQEEETFNRLVAGIRRKKPVTSSVLVGQKNPYRGLQVFDIEHSRYFFGRSAVVEWLLDAIRPSDALDNRAQLKDNRFLAIIGASGSGKSSVARAGLLAALQQCALPGSEHWPQVILKPGEKPLQSLAVALSGQADLPAQCRAELPVLIDRLREFPSKLHDLALIWLGQNEQQRLIILADQFEETFTLCKNPDEQRAFIDNLLHAAHEPTGRVIVILTLRADFYQKLTVYEALASAVGKHQYLLSPLSEEELREAIIAPAQLVGYDVEPLLVEDLVKDTLEQAGGLPLLQYALMQLWEFARERNESVLRLEDYRDVGGLAGALERRANKVYEDFSAQDQALCRLVFQRLVRPGEGTADTRRRAELSEFQEKEGQLAVLESMTNERLLTTQRREGLGFVEVAHEALIGNWSRLRNWIDGERDLIRLQDLVSREANEWEDKGRVPGRMLTEARLLDAENWLQDFPDRPTALERVFIETEIRERDQKLEEEKQQQEKILELEKVTSEERQRALEAEQATSEERQRALEAEQRKSESQKRLTGILGVVAAVMIGVAGLAWHYFLQAEKGQELLGETNSKLEQQTTELEKNNLKLEQQTTTLEKINLSLEKQKEQVLKEKERAEEQERIAQIERQKALTEKEKAEEQEKIAQEQKLEAEKQKEQVLKEKEIAQEAAKKAEQERLEAERQKQIAEKEKGRAERQEEIAQAAAKVAEEKNKEAEHRFGLILNEKAQRAFDDKDFNSARLYAQYALLAVQHDSKDIVKSTLNKINTGHTVSLISHRPHDSGIVEFLSDNVIVSVDNKRKTLIFINLMNGKIFREIKVDQEIYDLKVDPKNKLLALKVMDYDEKLGKHKNQAIKVIHLNSGEVIFSISPSYFIKDIAISYEKKQLMIFGVEDRKHKRQIYDINTGNLLRVINPHFPSIAGTAATYSPGSKYLIHASSRELGVWDANTGGIVKKIEIHDGHVQDISISSDSKFVALGFGATGKRNAVQLVDLKNDGKVITLGDHKNSVSSVNFSPDGKKLISTGGGRIKIWNVETGLIELNLTAHDSYISSNFDLNGKYFLVASGNAIKLWSLQSKVIRKTLAYEHGDVVEFSTSGEKIAAAYPTNFRKIKIWDSLTGKLEMLLQHTYHYPSNISFSYDDRFLLIPSSNGVIGIWNLKKNRLHKEISVDKDVIYVNFSPSGEKIVTAHKNGDIIVWELSSEESIFHKKNDTPVHKITFGFDADTLIASYKNRNHAAVDYTEVFNIKDGLKNKVSEGVLVENFDFSKENILFRENDGFLYLWNESRLYNTGSKGRLASTSFDINSNGEELVSEIYDENYFLIWNAKNKRPIAMPNGHNYDVNDVFFSPDGRLMLK